MPQSNGSMFWTILTTVSASAVSLVAVAWLVRSIVTHWLSKDIESFKTAMQHANVREIEKLRADLNHLALEHQVKFSQLHAKVFETIAHLYKLIAQTQRTMAVYLVPLVLAGAPSEVERGNAAADSWEKLAVFFHEHEIYFDKETCGMINQYLEKLRKLHIEFQHRQHSTKGQTMEWGRIWDELTGEVDVVKKRLADNFRSKIGIEA